ncbi:hypothetical protein GCM10007423_64000 [Dyadobacter endophyticus]|uniref:Uncharacterized protein n=2 Tax=Dyadobacter endophyticus TaxID=1749036 RepID=A0ABQ1ZD61_9BACT|nr:hypothetical protein GCM10007423_64000 [Dyadobacter endophyticus]
MAYLNLTGSESGANLLEVTGYPFDENWFKERKPRTWVRCDETDCIYETDIIELLGNVHFKDQHLWDTICDGYYACDIPDAIKCGCKTEHELTKKLVAAAKVSEPSCSCSQRTSIPIVKQVH